jgi:hypothetical protein
MTDSSITPIRVTLLVLLALGSLGPSPAHAGPRMYSGELIIEAFGDVSLTGTSSVYQVGVGTGIPLSGRCNTLPYQEKVVWHGYSSSSSTLSPPPITLTIPRYGGQVVTVDTNSDTIPDIVAGCGEETLAAGNPLVGSGSLVTTGDTASSRTSMNPRGFVLPRSALTGTVSGASVPAAGTLRFSVHYGDLRNDSGVFAKSGGDGSFVVAHAGSGGTRKAVQVAGRNRFGGVMRLLGNYHAIQGYQDTRFLIGDVTWLFQYLGDGGQAVDQTGMVTAGRTATTVNYAWTRTSTYPFTSTDTQEVFKWTTGTVHVTALGGPFATVLEQAGFDSRTAMGAGQVQLVSPMLTHWNYGLTGSDTGAIGKMTLTFAPEPDSWLMLCAGLVALGLLNRFRRTRA